MYFELEDGIQLYNEKKYQDALAFFLSAKSEKEDVVTEINYYTGLTYMRLSFWNRLLPQMRILQKCTSAGLFLPLFMQRPTERGLRNSSLQS